MATPCPLKAAWSVTFLERDIVVGELDDPGRVETDADGSRPDLPLRGAPGEQQRVGHPVFRLPQAHASRKQRGAELAPAPARTIVQDRRQAEG